MEEMNLMNYVVIIYSKEEQETIIPFRKINRIDSYNGKEKKVVVNIEIDDDFSGQKIGTQYEILTIEQLRKRNKK